MTSIGMNKKYKCVFFDLDHTLWDYETNSRETLVELYEDYNLSSYGVTSIEDLYQQFKKVNLSLWDLYDRQLIDQQYIRAERFKQILGHFSAYHEKLSNELSDDYLKRCPNKGNLMPYANEVLEYLTDHYQLTVVTNGFDEIQQVKMTSGNLHRFFNHVVTSQKAGHRKPSQEIFLYALQANKIECCDTVMIGDNLVTDIGGARSASIESIFFNPEKLKHEGLPDYEISCLSELKKIL